MMQYSVLRQQLCRVTGKAEIQQVRTNSDLVGGVAPCGSGIHEVSIARAALRMQ